MVGAGAEPLVEALVDDREIPRIVGADSVFPIAHEAIACPVGRAM